MKVLIRIVYIILTPIFPLVMAVREWRYIHTRYICDKTFRNEATFIKVLYCHFDNHFEVIRYWNEYWEKDIQNQHNSG